MRFGGDCTCKELADYAQEADLGPEVIRAMVQALEFYERLVKPWGVEETGAWVATDMVRLEPSDGVSNFAWVVAPSPDLLADRGGTARSALSLIPRRLKALGVQGEGPCTACKASGRVVVGG